MHILKKRDLWKGDGPLLKTCEVLMPWLLKNKTILMNNMQQPFWHHEEITIALPVSPTLSRWFCVCVYVATYSLFTNMLKSICAVACKLPTLNRHPTAAASSMFKLPHSRHTWSCPKDSFIISLQWPLLTPCGVTHDGWWLYIVITPVISYIVMPSLFS